MATYTASYSEKDQTVQISTGGDIPEGYEKLGEWTDEDNYEGSNEVYEDASHFVWFHHVRDLLYTKGVLDMQRITIKKDDTVVVTDIKFASTSDLSLTAGATQDVDVSVEPGNATDKSVTAESSDTKIATVSVKGTTLTIKAVKEGNATITAKAGSKTATRKVVVKAKPAENTSGSGSDGNEAKQ